MKSLLSLTAIVFLVAIAALSSCAVQEEVAPTRKPAPIVEAKVSPPAKVPEVKVKPVKASGDLGLLDLEKNYLILVTKEGKLITADFTGKTNVQKLVPQPAKMSDINLGQSAIVTYVTKGNKNLAQSVEYTVKAKKGE
ncbi:MAG: hypothetical protein HYT78_04655 [Deltaproteobacteria bacterium]|nr:hypothetical protein [Deltaproteobacteria bacterium]